MRGGAAEAIDGVLFIVVLFVCVVLHEFGHVFAARRYGIGTSDVTLLPIGGVASLERMPEKPEPGDRGGAGGAGGHSRDRPRAGRSCWARGSTCRRWPSWSRRRSTLMGRVAAANVVLLVFNLIPAFPMDGGRVLRALLAIADGLSRGRRVSPPTIGQGLAVLFGFLGLFGNPLLVLIAVFIFLAASGEAGYVQARDYTRGYLASHAMITAFQTLNPASTADDAAALLLRTTQQEFPVVDGAGALRGVLTREALIAALREKGGEAPVLEIMERDVPTFPESACLDNVFEQLRSKGRRMVGVVDPQKRLVGYITSENLAELLMIRSSKDARAEQAA